MPSRPFGINIRPSGKAGWDDERNPIMAAHDISIAESELTRFAVPLDAARHIIAQNIQEHFDNQEDYDNMPWQQWSESYEARQENLGDILQRTYELEYAATDPNNFEVISGSVSAGSYGGGEVAMVGSSLPPYWIYHEEGIPSRKTGALPKRAFAGLDTRGEEQLFAVFDRWVEGTLLRMVGSGTRTQMLVRTPSGGTSFGPMVG